MTTFGKKEDERVNASERESQGERFGFQYVERVPLAGYTAG